MAKKAKPKTEESSDDTAGTGGRQQDGGGPSKMQMVREAIGELGSDAKPKDIGEYVRTKYNTEIPPPMISSYKSTITGGGGNRSRAGRGGAGGLGGDVSLTDVEAVRGLIDRLGADQLSRLVRVLS